MIAPDETTFAYLKGRPMAPRGADWEQALAWWKMLVTDEGETILSAGMVAGFKAGSGNGHHIVNRSSATATILEVGTRSDDDVCTYSDIDMRIDNRDGWFTRRDGTPYPKNG